MAESTASIFGQLGQQLASFAPMEMNPMVQSAMMPWPDPTLPTTTPPVPLPFPDVANPWEDEETPPDGLGWRDRPEHLKDSPGNPLRYIPGMMLNIIKGVPEIIAGLGTLMYMGVGDVIGAASQAVPGRGFFGVGGAIETKVEEEGYNFGVQNLKMMGKGLVQDYASRYGFQGIDALRDQIYNNPLSYILDYLAVGSGMKTGATTYLRFTPYLEDILKAGGPVSKGLTRSQKILGLNDEMTMAMQVALKTKKGLRITKGAYDPLLDLNRTRRYTWDEAYQEFGDEAGQMQFSDLPAKIVQDQAIGYSLNPAIRVPQQLFIRKLMTNRATDVMEWLDAAADIARARGRSPEEVANIARGLEHLADDTPELSPEEVVKAAAELPQSKSHPTIDAIKNIHDRLRGDPNSESALLERAGLPGDIFEVDPPFAYQVIDALRDEISKAKSREFDPAEIKVLKPWWAKSGSSPWSAAHLIKTQFGMNLKSFYEDRGKIMMELKRILDEYDEGIKSKGWTEEQQMKALVDAQQLTDAANMNPQLKQMLQYVIQGRILQRTNRARAWQKLQEGVRGFLHPDITPPKEGVIAPSFYGRWGDRVVGPEGYRGQAAGRPTLFKREASKLSEDEIEILSRAGMEEQTGPYYALGDVENDLKPLMDKFGVDNVRHNSGLIPGIDDLEPAFEVAGVADKKNLGGVAREIYANRARRRSYEIRIGDLNQTEQVIDDAVLAVRGDDVAYIKSGISGTYDVRGLPRDRSIHVGIQRGDDIIDIEIGTDSMLRASREAKVIHGDYLRVKQNLAKVERELRQAIKDPDRQVEASILKKAKERLQEEQRAIINNQDEINRMITRWANNPEGYDIMLQTVDGLRLWQMQHGQEPWIRFYTKAHPEWYREGINGPYSEAYNRAISPLKIEIAEEMFGMMQAEFQRWLEAKQIDPVTGKFQPLPQAVVMEKISRMLKEYGLSAKGLNPNMPPEFDAIIDNVIKDGPLIYSKYNPNLLNKARKGVVGARAMSNPERAAADLLSRVRTYAYEYIIRDGALPGWDWESFKKFLPQMPVYYPHIQAWKMKPSDALAVRIPPETVKQMHAVKPAFTKEWSGITWLRGQASFDVTEVYNRMATAFLRHRELEDAVENLRLVSHRVSDEELAWILANKEGAGKAYKLWAPDWILQQIDFQYRIIDNIILRMKNNGETFQAAAAETLDLMHTELMNRTLDALKNTPVYMVPAHVAEQFTSRTLKMFSPGKMQLFFDGPRNLWRASVLGMNPRWVIMNMMGNIVFTAIKNPIALRRIFGFSDSETSKFIDYVLSEIKAEAYGTVGGVGTGGSTGDILKRGFFTGEESTLRTAYADRAAGSSMPRFSKAADDIYDLVHNWEVPRIRWGKRPGFLPGEGSNQGPIMPGRYPAKLRTWGSHMEQIARRGIALDEAAKSRLSAWERLWKNNLDITMEIASKGIDSHTMAAMLVSANKTFGDYTTMSPVERDIIRRFIIPFYPFYRHVFKYALRMPIEHPLKSQVFSYFQKLDDDMRDILMPHYLRRSVPLGRFGGMDILWNMNSWNPMNVFEDMSGMDIMGPELKIAAAQFMGIDEFGNQYGPEDVDNVYQSPNGMRFVWDSSSNRYVPFTGTIHPPLWKIIAGQFGGPTQMLNLQGYKSRHPLMTASSMMGLSLSRYPNLDEHAMRVLEGMQQAMKYKGAP